MNLVLCCLVQDFNKSAKKKKNGPIFSSGLKIILTPFCFTFATLYRLIKAGIIFTCVFFDTFFFSYIKLKGKPVPCRTVVKYGMGKLGEEGARI